jgi:hypothetical protein
MKSFLISVLALVKGKKTSIVAIIGLTTTYLLAKAIIGNDEAIWISSVTAVVAGGANYADYKLSINANQKFGK